MMPLAEVSKSAQAMSTRGHGDLALVTGLARMLSILLLRAHRCDRWGRLRAWAWLSAMVSSAVWHGRNFIEFTSVQAGSINAVQDFDQRAFWSGRRRILWVILKMVAASSLQKFSADKLKNIWRSAMTTSLLHTYLDGVYYRAKIMGAVQNPDHRITSDVQSVLEDITDMLKMLPEHVTNVVGLTSVMWRTSRLACTILWSYVLGITLTTRIYFERRTTQLELAVQAVEAHFRYALLHIQEFAEGIAFHGASCSEEKRLQNMVRRLAAESDGLLTLRAMFGSIELTFSWIAGILPSMIMAPRFWRGLAKFADYSQMVNGFRKTKDALFFIADNFDKLSSVAARVERVQELQNFDAYQQLAGSQTGKIRMQCPHNDVLLCLDGVRVALPKGNWGPGRWLGKAGGISISVGHCGTLLIQGESGVGKSSLLRAIAGLWDDGAGSISRREVLFLPQTAYIPSGAERSATSLRLQLLYPDSAGASDAELRTALDQVDLAWLADDLDKEVDWSVTLSNGERQRLVFARLLIHLSNASAPVVLLDEATSACSEQAESRLYEALLARIGQGAVVSVGHRSSLRRFHQEFLTLEEGDSIAGSSAA